MSRGPRGVTLFVTAAVWRAAVCRLAGDRDRMLALFSFTTGPAADVISEFASTFLLPVVSAAPPAVDRSRRRGRAGPSSALLGADPAAAGTPGFAFHVRPLYTAAVVDVIRHYQWQHVFYVFDNADGMDKRYP